MQWIIGHKYLTASADQTYIIDEWEGENIFSQISLYVANVAMGGEELRSLLLSPIYWWNMGLMSKQQYWAMVQHVSMELNIAVAVELCCQPGPTSDLQHGGLALTREATLTFLGSQSCLKCCLKRCLKCIRSECRQWCSQWDISGVKERGGSGMAWPSPVTSD